MLPRAAAAEPGARVCASVARTGRIPARTRVGRQRIPGGRAIRPREGKHPQFRHARSIGRRPRRAPQARSQRSVSAPPGRRDSARHRPLVRVRAMSRRRFRGSAPRLRPRERKLLARRHAPGSKALRPAAPGFLRAAIGHHKVSSQTPAIFGRSCPRRASAIQEMSPSSAGNFVQPHCPGLKPPRGALPGKPAPPPLEPWPQA